MTLEEFTTDAISTKLLEYWETISGGRDYFGFEWGDFLQYLGLKPEPEGYFTNDADDPWVFSLWTKTYQWADKNFREIEINLRTKYRLTEAYKSSRSNGQIAFFTVEKRV